MSNIEPIIIPTVGRVVWFYPAPKSGEAGFACNESGGPYAAIIARVWNDSMVNLAVIDANGTLHSRTSVHLVQGDEAAPDSAFCGWMPFQKGQAAKQDAQTKETNGGPRIRTHREDLEQSAAHALASQVVGIGNDGARLGRQVRLALDALVNSGEAEPAPQVIALPVRELCAAVEQASSGPIKFDFGDAIRHVKDGQRVAREGWNGKGMFVYLNRGSECGSEMCGSHTGGVPRRLFDAGDFGTVTRMPNFNMRAADGSTVTGWLASQTDMLAEDWVLAE